MNYIEKHRGPLIIAVSFAILFLVFATSISCMGVYLKPVCEDFGISRTTFTLTITMGSIAMLLSAIVAGRLIQRCNIKMTMLAGTIACGISMFMYAFAPSIYMFYLAGFVMGASISFTCNIPISALMESWFREKKGTALGIAFVGTGAGAMILNPLYTFIIRDFGWRYSFGFAGLCIFLILIPSILLIIKRNSREEIESRENENNMQEQNDYFRLTDALKKPAVWAVFFAFIVASFIQMIVLNHGIVFWCDSGFNAVTAATFISIASGSLIVGKVIVGIIIDKRGTRCACIIGAVSLALCFLGFCLVGWSESYIAVVPFVVFYAFGVPLATVTLPCVITYMFPKCDFGSIMGFFCMTGGLGGMVQVFVSMSYDKTGSYNTAWAVGMGACLMMVVIFAISTKPQKKGERI